MTRTATAAIASRTNRSYIDELFCVALEIYEDGADSDDYIRVVDDNEDITLETHLFVGVPFGASLLTDSDQEVTATVNIQNVDKQIGLAVREASKIIRCRILVVDRTNTEIIYDSKTMVKFSNVEGNDIVVKGNLGPVVSELEPACFLRAIKSTNPGLYL